MNSNWEELLTAFYLEPGQYTMSSFGSGHIHDTYLAASTSSGQESFIFQRINTNVFPDLSLLMRNLKIVTSHIAAKNKSAGIAPEKHGIVLKPTREGKSYYLAESKDAWRVFHYIENQLAHDEAENLLLAYEGGKAIAVFQELLSDLDPGLIQDVIPQFHDLRMRRKQFNESLEVDADRNRKVADLIAFAHEHMAQYLHFIENSENRNFPVRLTHNDTKFNNILFQKSGEANCLIDLDLVMPGYAWFDFGDVLRTCASTAPEDEANTDNIGFRLEIFEAIARGYLLKASTFLEEDEIMLLHKAPQYFTFMQGVRFLSDFLSGDTYYKTAYPGHNFIRAKAQFSLLGVLKKYEHKMASIVESLLAN